MPYRAIAAVEPLVRYGQEEWAMGAAPMHVLRHVASAGVLMGMGYHPLNALITTLQWEHQGQYPLGFTNPASIPGILATLPGQIASLPGQLATPTQPLAPLYWQRVLQQQPEALLGLVPGITPLAARGIY